MSENKTKKLSREEIANIEIGNTEITVKQKWFITLFFLLFIGIYPCLQIFYHQPFGEWRNAGTIQSSIKAYETAVEDTSLLRKVLLTPAQRFLTGVFGLGNEKVIVGKDKCLFYAADYDYLINPGFLRKEKLHKRILSGVQPDPVKAIVDFKNQLASRGIRLILMPIPVKPMIYSDKLSGATPPLQNDSWKQFKAALEKENITMLDLSDLFVNMRKTGVEPYLKTDTHWTPEGMYAAAEKLAAVIENQKIPSKSSIPIGKKLTASGDIVAMLKLPDSARYFAPETIQLLNPDGTISRNSDVLLLGDSFCNIFSLEAMQWGAGSGFAEVLSALLKRPVDVILRNDAGAFATRQLLSQELLRGRDRLAGKKVVVWEFAIRELANGDWKMLRMDVGKTPEERFLEIREPRTVSAVVLAASIVPRPFSAPYKDHVMSLHLGDIDNGNAQALVYIVSMKDNVWTDAAKIRIGDTLKITLSPWSEQKASIGSWNRSELDDEALFLAEPCFGKILK
ncbi:MAG: hypothetical protein J6W81_04375 [Lentisphaeria bacterium]|nr:hypothetical protein [Lentisphaeria bacterium]